MFRLSSKRKSLRVIGGLLASLAMMGIAAGGEPLIPAAAQSTTGDRPVTGIWEFQAPYPTQFAINGVDMVTPTEAWAVAYTDILHSTDGGVTWENQPRPGADNLYAV